jgi:hypothetical protein
MHHCYMELAARIRREELLREAREKRLARALRSAKRNGHLLGRLHLRRLVLWRDPGYEASCASYNEKGEATPCQAGCTKTAGTA